MQHTHETRMMMEEIAGMLDDTRRRRELITGMIYDAQRQQRIIKLLTVAITIAAAIALVSKVI